ncbi:MAG: hypothetical protein P8Y70_06170 [Candidatus Lokiarchaeota archaeon]
MVRYYLLGLKIINILLFIWIISIFLSLFNIQVVFTTSGGNLVIIEVIFAIKNILSYLIYSLLFLLVFGVGILISLMITLVSGGNNLSTFGFFIEEFFKNFLGQWFFFPSGTPPDIVQIPNLLGSQVLTMTTDLYLLVFQILFIVSIIYALRSLYKNDPRYNIIAIGSLIMMMVTDLIFKGFIKMLDLFNLTQLFNNLGIINLNNLPSPLNPILSNLPINDFFVFLINPVALLAIIGYIYLEISFQTYYADIVTKPSLERGKRLSAQLELLQKESHYITANVDKIKEEAKKRREELGLEKQTLRKYFSKKETKFSYIKEMIERKRLETEEKKLISAASKTRRLGRYIDRLFREDKEAKETLTAKTAAPRSKNLATSTLLNSSVRIVILILISFVILHTPWFIINIFDLPPAITESLAMYSPEVIIILFLPILLIFPVLGKIISFIKHRSLILRLQQEGKIKEILTSVGDYVKTEPTDDDDGDVDLEEDVFSETS